MSIKPVYVEKILSGEKCYEYRKTTPKKDISKIIIYSTNPVKKVVGEVSVKNIHILDKEELWDKTKDKSGTSKDFYDLYFKNKNTGVAYELSEIKIYNPYKELSDLNINYVPQSFIYLD
jgi:predicted transcriptional regulator